MNIWSVCGFGLCAACIAVILRELGSSFDKTVSAVAGTAILAYVAVKILPVFDYVREISYETGLGEYFGITVRCLAIALVCELAAEICSDGGESVIGNRIETAGRAGVLIVSLPLLKKAVEFAKELL